MRLVIRDCLSDLLTAEDELKYIDPGSLSDAELRARSKALQDVGIAISALVANRLNDVNKAEQRRLDRLKTATSALRHDLERVKTVSETLQVTTKGLGVITSLIDVVT
jgi:hypothetical protein